MISITILFSMALRNANRMHNDSQKCAAIFALLFLLPDNLYALREAMAWKQTNGQRQFCHTKRTA